MKKPARCEASCTLSVKASSFGSLFSTEPNISSMATLDSVADWLPMKNTPSFEPQLGQP